METEAVSGPDIKKLLDEAYKTPPAIVKKVADLLLAEPKKKK